MIKMAWKFFVAMARHQWAKWQGYEVLAPVGIHAWRDRQCQSCEFNNEGQCMKCKCLVLSKTVMALEKCPVRKWNPVWIKRKGYDKSRI